ncbi:hypothetical protein FACS1894172_10640 [Spirochaetia bacterium]|nr:hypothetical protein FACS1894164_10610 [Spirochaetia bacterium]GHU32983.1 hypothetical protein FACS1894172_10640 [Spirochaetia bacterium]
MSVLHTIKAWLYENLLSADQNDYVARVSAERTLNVREICESAVERGGADISAAAMEHAVALYHKELGYRLCDGFSVNTGWYTASMHVKGVFDSPTSAFDPAKHTVIAEFHQGAELRKELAAVTVSILGKAESTFFITQVTDMRTGSVNDILTPGRNAKIAGSKLKVAGESATCGVYFVNTADQTRVKVDSADIVENQNAHLMVLTPALSAGTYQLEITTQYSGGSTLLKEPRTATFDRPLTVS